MVHFGFVIILLLALVGFQFGSGKIYSSNTIGKNSYIYNTFLHPMNGVIIVYLCVIRANWNRCYVPAAG